MSNTQSVRNINVTATFEGQTPGNSPPLAVADTATTTAGTAVNIVVLANDSDPDNDPLTITAVSNFVNGTATVNANNTVTFAPTAGFSGSDGFTYTISDGTTTSSAPVSVTVTPPPGNSPPSRLPIRQRRRQAPRSTLSCWLMTAIPTTIPSPLPPCRLRERHRNGQRQQHGHLYPHRGFQRFWRLYLHDLRRNDNELRASQRDGHAAARRRYADAARERERANNVFTLTTGGNQAGTAMSTGRIDVRQNFTIAFDVNLGASDGGADGAAFVLHNDPRGVNAIGGHGSGLAVGGIQNGLAIEFDTYNNGATCFDIASDHTGFLDTDSSFATPPLALPNIEDGAWHPVVVTWNATTQTLSYTFDGQPVGTPHQQHRYAIPWRLELRLFRLRRWHRRIEQHPKRTQHQRHRHLRRPDARPAGP